jgi:molybdopterin molybdotransferase
MTYLEYKEAVKTSLENVLPLKRSEMIHIQQAIGRVFSKDIVCVKNLPSFNNSAMDGFAIKHSDAGKKLKVKAVVFAGDNYTGSLEENECYKIMTGAKVPDDANTIIPIEETLSFDGEFVEIPQEVKFGNHFREKGEEQKEGNTLFTQGTMIDSNVVALLASQGITMVEVFVQPSIAVVSTGNELKEPWEQSNEDEIYNSNSYAIVALLKEYHYESTYAGVIPDNLEQSIAFIGALKNYDVVITTGGISMGDADFIAQAFVENGLEVLFHGVNVKPGRPTMMGLMNNTYVMAMPGNPLTALVNTYLFALPVVSKLSGSDAFYHDFIYAKNKEAFKVNPNRANIVLGKLIEGEFYVTRKNKYGSGMLTPLIESNCVMVTLNGKSNIEEDEFIKVIPFGMKLHNKQTDNKYN